MARVPPHSQRLIRTPSGRLRTPWRLALGVVGIAVVAGGGAVIGGALGVAGKGVSPTVNSLVATTGTLLPVVGGIGGIVVATRLLDRRPLVARGAVENHAARVDAAGGLALSLALSVLVLGLELFGGYARVTGWIVMRSNPSLPVAAGVSPGLAFVLVVAYFLAAAIFEELLFRGYLMANVADGLTWFGLGRQEALLVSGGLTSLAFGLGHAGNPHAGPLPVAVIALYGGLLAGTVLVTGRLAFAVGLHLGWNVAVSSIVGVPVSGFTSPVTLVAVEVDGPELVTGGAFGPEGGLLAIVALVCAAFLVGSWVRWREGSIAIRWAQTSPRNSPEVEGCPAELR